MKTKRRTPYFWGKYKNEPGYQLLFKQGKDYFTFAWDCPLTDRDLAEYSEFIPVVLLMPDGRPYGG